VEHGELVQPILRRDGIIGMLTRKGQALLLAGVFFRDPHRGQEQNTCCWTLNVGPMIYLFYNRAGLISLRVNEHLFSSPHK